MRRREIFIELTSLLDVILIMLFVLLTQAKTQADAAVSSAAEAEAAAASVQEELTRAETERDALREKVGQLEREGITLGVVEENSLVVTLSVQAGEPRAALIEPRDGASLRISLDPEDENYTVNRLRTALTGLLRDSGKETVFVVFQFDRNAIYQTEYLLLTGVVRQLKQEAESAGMALQYIETDLTQS